MRKTLLLADDSVTIQKVVGISFASEDVTLITVDNGDDAIAKAREATPDAILADVVMPGKSGYEVCEAIKKDPALRHIPVLLLTGTFEAFDEERAERCGAAGHVAKPFEAQTLVDKVRELLARAPTTPEAPPSPPAAPRVAPAQPGPPAPDGAQSFDFFDDDLIPSAAPAAEPAAAPAGPAPPDLDPSGGAFAFGEGDLGDDDLDAPLDTGPPLAGASAGAVPERTVAILPGERGAPPAGPAEAPSGFGGFADDLLGPDLSGSADVLPSGEDSFDFDIGGAPEPARPAREPSLVGDDLAQATVLDPKGASGYDVSSSDLGDSLAAGPPAAGPDPRPAPAVAAPERPPIAAAEPARLPPLSRPAPVAAREPASRDPVVPATPAYGASEPVEPTDAALDAAFDVAVEEAPAVPVTAVDESALEDLMPPVAAEPEEAPPAVAATHDPAALAGVALAEITPRLREQLHDTLEKVAWESFGDVGERLVQQALERVERVAWEVIPQMAETLIREEIRRMKGEVED